VAHAGNWNQNHRDRHSSIRTIMRSACDNEAKTFHCERRKPGTHTYYFTNISEACHFSTHQAQTSQKVVISQRMKCDFLAENGFFKPRKCLFFAEKVHVHPNMTFHTHGTRTSDNTQTTPSFKRCLINDHLHTPAYCT